MGWHDPITTLRQTRAFAQEAIDLVADRVVTLALTRLLELVGDSANRVDEDVRDRYKHLPWREVISLRNRLIHGHGTVNVAVLWQIVQDDLPPSVRDLGLILDRDVT